jgi:hypothetical protein
MHHGVGGVAVEPVVVANADVAARALASLYSALRKSRSDPSRIHTLCHSPSRQALGPSIMRRNRPNPVLQGLPTSVRAIWRPRCQSIMPISLGHTADSLERSGWIAPTMTPPSNPPVASSTGTMWSFGRWIGLSSGSMPRQRRNSVCRFGPAEMTVVSLVPGHTEIRPFRVAVSSCGNEISRSREVFHSAIAVGLRPISKAERNRWPLERANDHCDGPRRFRASPVGQ